MKVNLGSGYKRIDGFVNVDHDPLVKPDYIVDFEFEPLPFEDSSVLEIVAHHVLEHIGENFLNLMKELYRVSKHGAILDIKFPHYRSDIQHMDPTHKRTITVDQLLLFSKSYNRWHIENFNSSSGFGLKLDVDFEVVQYRNVATPKWEERFKTMTEEDIQEVSENLNNVYVETHVIMKVIKDEQPISDC